MLKKKTSIGMTSFWGGTHTQAHQTDCSIYLDRGPSGR